MRNPSNTPTVLAAITARPCSAIRQRLRALKEAGLFPSGKSVTVQPAHIARLVLALASDRVAEVGRTVAQMRVLHHGSADLPPGNVEQTLVRLMETDAPLLGEIDVSAGHLAIDVERRELTLHGRDLLGRPAEIQFSAATLPAAVVTNVVVFPIRTVREIARSLK